MKARRPGGLGRYTDEVGVLWIDEGDEINRRKRRRPREISAEGKSQSESGRGQGWGWRRAAYRLFVQHLPALIRMALAFGERPGFSGLKGRKLDWSGWMDEAGRKRRQGD